MLQFTVLPLDLQLDGRAFALCRNAHFEGRLLGVLANDVLANDEGRVQGLLAMLRLAFL